MTMFMERIRDLLQLEFENHTLVKDSENILEESKMCSEINRLGFTIHEYNDVEDFRFLFESKIKVDRHNKYLIVVRTEIYIPYDILQFFNVWELSYSSIFPKLDSYTLKRGKHLDLNLISIAYGDLYGERLSEKETNDFISNTIYKNEYKEEYIKFIDNRIRDLLDELESYKQWFEIAELKATRNIMAIGLDGNYKHTERRMAENFKEFLLKNYGKLSGITGFDGPVLVSKVLDYLLMKNDKIALIVMDGMSISDWQIIKKSIEPDFELRFSFAMLPTITAISRQSLLSGKLPIAHKKPFTLANEKNQFIAKANEIIKDSETINYYRGYDFEISYKDRFICTIINDIDDLVHSQLMGISGHFEDIRRMSGTGRLNDLINRLLGQGFEVYITSDHGNTEATGMGRPKGMGVEVETKSQRMLILKDYASVDTLKGEFRLSEHPSYYLPKEFSYFVCEDGTALGKKGDVIMSHGGTSIEEVIVPFIKIKGDNR